jgi:nucleosome-remodeling factor subunit BPTF
LKNIGYNTSAYHESEYHYGSDFGDSSDSKSDNDDDNLLSPALSEESMNGNESDNSDFSLHSYTSLSGKNGSGDARPSTPNPLWLQNENLPPLELPPSSDDLMIPPNLSLKITSIYEVMRRFRNLVRLSPFRLEDFCAAVVYEDQSALLTEIHIMLLKAILREEDSQQTHFGPLDQKDSFNIALYLIDNITWPEVLRCYVESDVLFDANVLDILTSQEYPYVSVEDRLTVLQFLTDQFLITTIVRDDLLQEGPIHYDDHCRICHRLGDLLCCETCPAVFHLECVDPPLDNVPTEDWQCNICKSHKVVGVADCVSRMEKIGTLCRQEPLGFDRHGRKYWFVARRLFIETEDALEIHYYSTIQQFDLLLTLLDNNLMEAELCRAIDEIKSELIRQMQITESLTNQMKGNKKSYFDIQNARVADIREKILAEKTAEDAELAAQDSQRDPETEEGFNKTENESNDKQAGLDTNKPKDIIKSTEYIEGYVGLTDAEEQIDKKIITPNKTGLMTAKAYIAERLKRKSRISSILSAAKEEATAEMQSTRSKSVQLANGTLHYKLGMENAFRNYINQFSVNPIALNKPQRNEERDKKRHLSHKFSLTPASEFKWMGIQINMTKTNMIATLKQTLIGFDQNIATQFMHPNWPKLRKTWLNTVSTCNTPREFSRALIVFHACLKSVVYANVWHEQLGHLKLYRITAAEREDKKKLEKREKREREDEEERNRMAYNFVKYSLGLKHQVWKQKGEEYRIHGQWGWVWMSATRRMKVPVVSERIVPQKIMLRVKHQNSEKIISVDPNTHQYLLKTCNKELISNNCEKFETDTPPELKDIELLPVVTTFVGIDVSRALTTSGRLLYPKIAKRCKLNDLLSRRIQLRELEEKSFGVSVTKNEDKTSTASIENDDKITSTSLEPELHVSEKPGKITNNQQMINSDLSSALINRIQTVRVKYGHLNRLGKQYACYARSCTSNSSVISLPVINNCYSPLCIQKTKLKTELLLLIKKAQTDGLMTKEQLTALTSSQKKPSSILEQKLSEGKTCIEERNSESYNIFSCVSFEDPRAVVTKDLNDAIDKSYDCDESFLESCLLFDEPSTECIKIEDVKQNDVTEHQQQAATDKNIVEIPNSEVLMKEEEKSSADIEAQNKDENSNSGDKLIHEGVVARRPGRPPRKVKAMVENVDTTISEDKKETSSIGNYIPHRINRRFALASKIVKTEEVVKIEKEYAPNGSERVYSATSTVGKLYLKKANEFLEKPLPVKMPQINKFPVVGNFDTKKRIKSILAVPVHELNKLARTGGRLSVNGFHHLAKNNPTIWNYPCSRPLFKTCWLFRCINIKTLSAIAQQLRILWTCLRWDDMATRPQNSDGKHQVQKIATYILKIYIYIFQTSNFQVTTETEIMSSELLKHQYVGKFLEKTQYLRRKVVIPLELPKTIRGEMNYLVLNL